MIQQMTQDRVWGQIVAKAWSDEDFKQRVLSDPELVFAEHGLELPEGTGVIVHDEDTDTTTSQDTKTMRHFFLPASPDGDLIEEELVGTGIADGTIVAYCGYCGRCGRCGCGCVRCWRT
jgi:hypothetical protein